MAEGRVGWVQDIAYFEGDEPRYSVPGHLRRISSCPTRIRSWPCVSCYWTGKLYAPEVHRLVPRLNLNGSGTAG